MNSPVSLAGIALVLIGVFALAYEGFNYTKQEEVAKIGDLKITAETDKRVHFPPYLGGIALVAGLVLVVVGRKK